MVEFFFSGVSSGRDPLLWQIPVFHWSARGGGGGGGGGGEGRESDKILSEGGRRWTDCLCCESVVDNGVSPILLLQDLIHHVAIETAVACTAQHDHAGVYGGRSLRPVAARGYPHKPPPQQVVYHQCTPLDHGLYILVHENTISFYPLAVESSDWRCCLLLLPNGEGGPQTHGMKAVKFSANL